MVPSSIKINVNDAIPKGNQTCHLELKLHSNASLEMMEKKNPKYFEKHCLYLITAFDFSIASAFYGFTGTSEITLANCQASGPCCCK